MKNFLKYIMIASVLAFGLAACDPNEADDAASDAGAAVQDTVEDAGDAVQGAADDAGDAVQGAADDTQDAAGDATDGN